MIKSTVTPKPFHKIRISRITTHAEPYPMVHGFTLSSVSLDANSRACSGDVHSRHVLSRSMNDVELWLQATLFLTGHNNVIPAHIDHGSVNDISWAIGTLSLELARLMSEDVLGEGDMNNVAAANIAIACFEASRASTQIDMLAVYLQTVVGLFESEGAVATVLIYEGRDHESPSGVGHCCAKTHTPEETCRVALEMLFELITNSRHVPDMDNVDGTFMRRRAMSLMKRFEPSIKIAIQKFLSTINDRAPCFWAELDDDDGEGSVRGTELQTRAIRIME